ncbi:eCIS core domain-containing protein [Methanosarcina mazei]|nr:DUF4157 domain-containing protein [Methanosarcina mazei]
MAEHQQAQKSSESKSNIQTRAILPKQIPVSHPAAIIQRARINPKSLTHADVMQLQRTIGNRAVGRLLSEVGLIPSKVNQAPPIQMQKTPEEEEKLQMKSVMQRQEIPEEEEPIQGKFEIGHEREICPSCIQRQEIPEEEEPLQGKMGKTIQLQEIQEEEEPLQGKMIEPIQRQEIPEEEKSLQTKRENNTGMPDNLKAGVENLSGIDMSDVMVHYNSSKPAKVGALAYTQGTNIHVAPGQERYLPHEAWHVVQQAQGRVKPTIQLKEIKINDDEALEREADILGRRASDVAVKSMNKTKLLPLQQINNGAVQGAFYIAGRKYLLPSDIENNGVLLHALQSGPQGEARLGMAIEMAISRDVNEILIFNNIPELTAEINERLRRRALPPPQRHAEYPFPVGQAIPQFLYRWCTRGEAQTAIRRGIRINRELGGIHAGIPTMPNLITREQAQRNGGGVGIRSAEACLRIDTHQIPQIAQRQDNSIRRTPAQGGTEFKILVDIPPGAIKIQPVQ